MRLTADRDSYVAEYVAGSGLGRQFAFTIVARFENGSRDTVFLARCYPDSPIPVYAVLMSEQGHSAYNSAWACVGHDRQFAVAPGQIRIDTLQLRGPTASAGMTGEPLGAFSGRMALYYEVQTCRGDGSCRFPAAGRSPAFIVERAP